MKIRPVTFIALMSLTIALSSVILYADSAAPAIPQDIPPSSATVPICEGFESGTLPSYMAADTTTAGSGTGMVQIATYNAHTGSRAIQLYSHCGSSQCFGSYYTHQALIVAVDLAGVSGPELNFWVRENYSAGNDSEDGVFISDNGGSTWARVHDLNTATAVYERVVIDLQAAAAGAGMSLVDGFLVKLQSYEKVPTQYDDLEYSLDDICIQVGQPLLENSRKIAPPVAISGRTLTYTIAISNTGSGAAANTSLIDPLPTGVAYVPGSATNGATYDTGEKQIEWTGDVAAGATVEVSFAVTATAPAGSKIVNTATISNTGLSATEQVSATTGVVTAAPLGACADFEGGVLPGFIVTETAKYGRAQVTGNYPFDGSYALDLDSDSSFYSRRAAIMAVDLAGETNVEVSVWMIEHYEADDSQNGIFISNDGGLTYTRIRHLGSFGPEEPAYENIVLDLVAAAADAGVTLTDGFLVKFQSYTPYSVPTGGHSLDNICVQPLQPHLEGSIKGACAAPAGGPYPFVISMRNTGLVSATGVTLIDPIPSGTNYVASSVTGGATYNSGLDQIEWTGIITAGEAIDVSFAVTSTAPTVPTNTAIISHTGMSAPLVLEDAGAVIDPSAPITLTKSLFNTSNTVLVGEPVDFTLFVENASPYTFCKWEIHDHYDDCLTYEDASEDPEEGCVSCRHLIWYGAGPLWPGERRSIRVSFRADQPQSSCENRVSLDVSPLSRESAITVEVVGPRIHLTKTVGSDPSTCATTKAITVPAGTDVTYCYKVENKGTLTLSRHYLDDDKLGAILSYYPHDLEPGETTFVTRTATITRTTTNEATWRTYISGFDPATSSSSATVNVLAPTISLTKTVGTDPATCATTPNLTVDEGADVVYCYQVQNTGVFTLTSHDLYDDKLGDLLTNYAYTLTPGASTFITATTTITQNTVNSATWTAADGIHAPAIATAIAQVTLPGRTIYLPIVLRSYAVSSQ